MCRSGVHRRATEASFQGLALVSILRTPVVANIVALSLDSGTIGPLSFVR